MKIEYDVVVNTTICFKNCADAIRAMRLAKMEPLKGAVLTIDAENGKMNEDGYTVSVLYEGTKTADIEIECGNAGHIVENSDVCKEISTYLKSKEFKDFDVSYDGTVEIPTEEELLKMAEDKEETLKEDGRCW